MLKRLGLLSLLAAAVVTLTGCEQTAADATPSKTATPSAAATELTGVPTGGKCGTIAGLTCGDPADYCNTEIGQCKSADAAGTCTKRPEICTKERNPVCGCDGKTYGNACEAASAGMSVQSAGECKPEG